MPYNASQNEKEVLAFWDNDKTFEKSVQERPDNTPYVFYDGPPFATGLPHYGHIVGSVMKDVVPRYHTMRGKRVERVWGWDCHGLPIENIVEKELGTKSKQDIEALGVEKFNELCRSKVLGYVDEWEKTIHRLGRWVDMKHAYRTMDIGYMESVWWVFKQLWDKDLIYKGHRAMHICPRCETTLSQQEVSEGYKDIKDLSVTAQFKLTNAAEKLGIEGDVYLLAWTTTPWTLPGNVLLAVGAEIEYVAYKRFTGEWDENRKAQYDTIIVAKKIFDELLKTPSSVEALPYHFMFDKVPEGHETPTDNSLDPKVYTGTALVGLTYEPLFPYFAGSENAFRVVTAAFVTTEDGTGVVHIAPGFGTDDYEIFKQEGVPFIQHVGMNGRFIDAVTDFAGMHVKPAEDHMATDVEIIKWLAANGKLFSKKKYEHSYPHCWRCDTPLLNYATTSWFVAVTKVKEQALKEAEHIVWSPEHIKEGRFGKWLEGARDWSISRQRFWASVMPVWECEQAEARGCAAVVVGSVQELEERSGQKVTDLHKHIVDHITMPCAACGGTMRRIPDVLDTWFDSGSMPYAQVHYPFENKEKFEGGFPAEFIAEGQDQTRAWFYYLHILGTALRGTSAFRHVIVNGIVLAEDGKKMSKKLQNYPDPSVMLETYGADALRFYLMNGPIVAAESLNFSEDGVREVFNKVVNTLANVLSFYEMFASEVPDVDTTEASSDRVLDRWIVARLHQLMKDVTSQMEAYRLNDAARPIMDFILDLSQWYVRRSRDRMKRDDVDDKRDALATLGYVLKNLSLVMAPFTPFISEKVWYAVTGKKESVHLQMWPEAKEEMIDDTLLSSMELVRSFATIAHMQRKQAAINVRQPLQAFTVHHDPQSVAHWDELQQVLAEEINVKEVKIEPVGPENTEPAYLDTILTPELKKEGALRELIRAINDMRKEQGLTRANMIRVRYRTESAFLQSVLDACDAELREKVLAGAIEPGEADGTVTIDGEGIALGIASW